MSAEHVEQHQGEPPCPVHPYGYHRGPRVNAPGRRDVFRHSSPIGFPARCDRLERELEEADREVDFIDELWERERTSRGHGLAIVGAAATIAVVGALLVGAASSFAIAVAALAGGAATALLDRGDAALERERLRRIRDWHKRVGAPR